MITPKITNLGYSNLWSEMSTILDGEAAPTPSTVESMLVTPAYSDISILSASDLEIDWGDGTVQTVKSGDDTTYEMYGLIANKYSHTYTDSYNDKTISIKHLDGKSPIQFFSVNFIKTVQRWYSEGYQPFKFSFGIDQNLTFYGLGSLLEAVPNVAPPKTTDLSGLFMIAALFNQDISGWDVSNVTSLFSMFSNAAAFNQPLNTWDVSNVTDMGSMFQEAISFNQDLSQWCVSNITSEPSNFSDNSPLTAQHKPVWGTCPSDEEDSDGDEPTPPTVDPFTALFEADVVGAWIDPNDMSTMFQDAEATIPVTAVGQTVGCIKSRYGDKAWVQPTASKQPLLQYDSVNDSNYLLFDGIDDEFPSFAFNNHPNYLKNVFYISGVKILNNPIGATYRYINPDLPVFYYQYNTVNYSWSGTGNVLPSSVPKSPNQILSYTDNALPLEQDVEAYITSNGYIYDRTPHHTKSGLALGCTNYNKFVNMAFYGAYIGLVFIPKTEIYKYQKYFSDKMGVSIHVP